MSTTYNLISSVKAMACYWGFYLNFGFLHQDLLWRFFALRVNIHLKIRQVGVKLVCQRLSSLRSHRILDEETSWEKKEVYPKAFVS